MGNGLICQQDQRANVIEARSCRVWSGIANQNFKYPELEENECPEIASKPLNFGIALSGGGFRAASLAIGTLRGLHQLGIFSKSRYISSNSGSSWVNGPLSYSQSSLDEFLGKYLAPADCTLENLRHVDPACHSFTICGGGNLDTFLNEFRRGVITINDKDPRGFWSQAIGKIFFRHYGLDNFDRLPIISRHSLEPQIPLPRKCSPYDVNRSPFPIINGTALIRGHCMFAPIEFTPLYYGFPGCTEYRLNDNHSHHVVGGYLIEPHGFTSEPTTSQSSEVKKILNPENLQTSALISRNNLGNQSTPLLTQHDIQSPKLVISVSDQAGISSSAVTQSQAHSFSNRIGKALDFASYPIWNPLTGECHDMILADGAGCDNTAIISLLRRKVTQIFAMYAMNCSIADAGIDHCNLSHSSFGNVAGLFGVMTCDGETTLDGIKPKYFNHCRQVFPSEDFLKLLDGLRARYLEGAPTSFLLRTRALSNPFCSVPGDHSVDLLFMINAPSDRWVNSLPSPVRTKVLFQRRALDQVLNKQQDQDFPNESSGSAEREILSSDDNDDDEKENNTFLSFFDELEIKFQKKVEEMNNRLSFLSEDRLPPPPPLNELRERYRNIFKTTNFRNFPFSSIESFDYTAQLVNLLTNLMTWEVLESQDLFAELLR
jgi:hypothetical protein